MLQDSDTQVEITLQAASRSCLRWLTAAGSRHSQDSEFHQLYWQPQLVDFRTSYISSCLLASNIKVLLGRNLSCFVSSALVI